MSGNDRDDDGRRADLFETDALKVGPSLSIRGDLGVLSKKDFTAGAVLCLVRGPILAQASKYSFCIGIDRHIEPQHLPHAPNFGRFMNHSCDPTAFARVVDEHAAPFVEVVARRAIKAGDELTFDYASLEYEVTVGGTSCRCGTSSCRGTIQGFRDLPRAIAEQYLAEGVLPEHLARILDLAAVQDTR